MDRYVRVFHIGDHTINDLGWIVRRHISCHTYGDTGCTVDQQIWQSGRKDQRFLLAFIKVWSKWDKLFVQIIQHCHSARREACLRITHGSSTVTVDRAKVTMAVNKWDWERILFCHMYQCVIDRTVAMWMIFTHGITDNTRALSMWLIRSQTEFRHCI